MERESLLLLKVVSGKLAGRSFPDILGSGRSPEKQEDLSRGNWGIRYGVQFKADMFFFRQVSEQWLGGKWLS